MKRLFFWKRDDEDRADAPNEEAPSGGLLTGDPVQDSESIEILLQSIAEVNESIDLDDVLHDIVDKSISVTDAERGILLLGDEADGMTVRLARSRAGENLPTDVTYSRTLVRKSIDGKHAVRSVVQSDREALELGQSVFNLKLRAVMCVPLLARGRMIGVIYVDSKAVRREFSSRDEALFGAMSAQLAIALENARLYADSLEKVRLEKDFEIAKRIQQHLLSPVPKDLPGIDLAVRFYARDEASGDSYDMIPLSEGRLVLMIGDVTGHGVGAALLTHAAQAALRSYIELVDDLSEVATRLNNRLVASVETGNFMSLLIVLVDPYRMEMSYVNCGHPSLVLVRDGKVAEFEKSGMVLGVVGDQVYPARGPIPIQAGDMLYLHTDGVDETMNNEREMFGIKRIHEHLESSSCSSSEDLLTEIERATLDFAGGVKQDDDLTMMALKVLPTS